jgi:hypothetical protein
MEIDKMLTTTPSTLPATCGPMESSLRTDGEDRERMLQAALTPVMTWTTPAATTKDEE